MVWHKVLCLSVAVISLSCYEISSKSDVTASTFVYEEFSNVTVQSVLQLIRDDHEYQISSSSNDDSEMCTRKLLELLEAFEQKKNLTESLKFFDALGKPPSGILDGNSIFLGSYDSCKSLQASTNENYKPCKIVATAMLERKTPIPVTWTTCFPKDCRGGNYTALKETILKIINSYPKQLFIPAESVITTCDEPVEYSAGAYVAIIMVSVIAFLVIVGTAWDPIVVLLGSLTVTEENKVLVNAQESGETEEIIRDDDVNINYLVQSTPETVKPNIVGDFFKCFALQRTWPALLSTSSKEGQILCLNGIRVLSINWVVLGHVYFISTAVVDNTSYLSLWRRVSMSIIYNGYPAVDTFFLLSGFLVSFLLSKQLSRSGRFDVMGYYLHRYIRLTLPFLFVTLCQGFLATIYIRGPFQDILQLGHNNCKKWWWANLLYINNLVPWDKVEICIGQSWYLSNDFQFFVIAPFFVYLLYRRPTIGVFTCGVALLASCITSGVITSTHGYGPTTVFDSSNTSWEDFRVQYIKPWCRIPPYLIGIFGGWLCYRHIDSMKLYVSRSYLVTRLCMGVVVWTVSCTIEYWVVFGLHNDMVKKTNGEAISKLEGVAYESLARSAWAIALLFQILACQVGLGGIINTVLSWKGWIALSRLTFSVYLLHYIIIQSFVVQLRHPMYYRPDYEIAILYVGFLGLSYAAASLLFTCIEQPVAFIERLTYRK